MYVYSKSAGGFFVRGLHADIPDDAADVSAADYAALMAAQAAGKRIVAGPNGPEAVDPTPLPPPASWYVPVPLLRQRLEMAGKWAAAATAIMATPATMLKLVTLEQGVAHDDEEALTLLRGIGADPAVILARPGA